MRERILILGIGNVLWADEGFGVRCVERLASQWALPPNVRVMDGGMQGLYLLPFLEEADTLIVFDAVDCGLPPGMLKVVEGEAVPAFMAAQKISLHQTGFQNVLATATLMGCRPADLMLIGCQPDEREDYDGSLRAVVADQIGPGIDVALRKLRALGVTPRPGLSDPALLADPAILRDACAAGRPSAETACRIGDARVLPGRG